MNNEWIESISDVYDGLRLRRFEIINSTTGEVIYFPNPQSPIPNPQSPIPNPQFPVPNSQSPIPSPQSPIPSSIILYKSSFSHIHLPKSEKNRF
ncbi:MAG: hypothetical protein HWQ44_06580 [Nostoc sp. JL34]|uniref:hypothetical protein n=1 Tax=Nostoc sp. JL34 TaxID=2815397 RepID=UPI001D550991|nr:hypothetical protein [Nostoc sp. JL34]MBN3882651.1 hypothetical protein [Nostoc sp. JL34]